MKHDTTKMKSRDDLASYCKGLSKRLKGKESKASLLLEIRETAQLNNSLLLSIAKEDARK